MSTLGINLAAGNDYNPDLPFRDLVRQSRAVTSSPPEGGNSGPPLTLRSDGYPAYLQPGCSALLGVLSVPAGSTPAGDYVLEWDGTGTVSFLPGFPLIYSAPGKRVYRVTSTGNAWVSITSTEVADPVRNVRLYQPGEEYSSGIWSSAFLKRWKGVKCLRFMDWMRTNNSTQSAWADRTKPESLTWSAGVPIEAMCDLANQLGIDPWFCIPHLADDGWLAGLAKAVQTYLSAKPTPIFEFSNELWNSGFAQARYLTAQARAAGIDGTRYVASQVTRIFKVLETLFGTRPIVRVISGQQANPWILQTQLEYQDTAQHVDAVSCSYYMHLSMNPQAAADFVQQNQTPAQAVAALRATLPAATKQVSDHQALATKYGKRLIAYEGGSHMVGVGGAENNQALTDLLIAANASQEMGDLYRDWYKGWQANTSGDLVCHFNSLGWSKWGCWGLSPDAKQVTPKHQAFLSLLGGN